jgi:flagellar biosynthesis chaperone FliJ
MLYEDSGAICSYSEYIDELEKEIAEKDKELQLAKELIKELSEIWANGCLIHDMGSDFNDFIERNTDKIKALLGEE